MCVYYLSPDLVEPNYQGTVDTVGYILEQKLWDLCLASKFGSYWLSGLEQYLKFGLTMAIS